jgi:hypothetical protein
MLYGQPLAPLGTRGVLTVQLYSDGAGDSLREKAVIEQLQKEFHGDIRFEIFDLNEHPEMLDKKRQWSDATAPSAPSIRIRMDWLDRYGHRLNTNWQGAGLSYLVSKRVLLEQIVSNSQHSYNALWPRPQITRTLP